MKTFPMVYCREKRIARRKIDVTVLCCRLQSALGCAARWRKPLSGAVGEQGVPTAPVAVYREVVLGVLPQDLELR